MEAIKKSLKRDKHQLNTNFTRKRSVFSFYKRMISNIKLNVFIFLCFIDKNLLSIMFKYM